MAELPTKPEAPQRAEQPQMPAGAHVFTPDTMCHAAFQRSQQRDHATVASLGLASNEQLLAWVKPDSPENPPPQTWRNDDKGHLTDAGNRFHADYDKQGNLTRVTEGDHTWEKTGPSQVTETAIGNDGKPHQYVTDGVTSFTATPFSKENDGQWGGFAGVEVKVAFGSGSYSSESATLYENATHQVTVNSYWNSERVCENLVPSL